MCKLRADKAKTINEDGSRVDNYDDIIRGRGITPDLIDKINKFANAPERHQRSVIPEPPTQADMPVLPPILPQYHAPQVSQSTNDHQSPYPTYCYEQERSPMGRSIPVAGSGPIEIVAVHNRAQLSYEGYGMLGTYYHRTYRLQQYEMATRRIIRRLPYLTFGMGENYGETRPTNLYVVKDDYYRRKSRMPRGVRVVGNEIP